MCVVVKVPPPHPFAHTHTGQEDIFGTGTDSLFLHSSPFSHLPSSLSSLSLSHPSSLLHLSLCLSLIFKHGSGAPRHLYARLYNSHYGYFLSSVRHISGLCCGLAHENGSASHRKTGFCGKALAWRSRKTIGRLRTSTRGVRKGSPARTGSSKKRRLPFTQRAAKRRHGRRETEGTTTTAPLHAGSFSDLLARKRRRKTPPRLTPARRPQRLLPGIFLSFCWAKKTHHSRIAPAYHLISAAG